MRYWVLLVVALLPVQIAVSASGDCSGTPDNAVMKLPEPLATWGQIVCTPYGHIVAPGENWIWSNPGAFSPVMVPSQMVRQNPAPVGNESFFVAISVEELAGSEAVESISVLERGLAKSDPPPTPLKVTFVSSSGKSIILNFYRESELKSGGWGVWCDSEGVCASDTRFMILNMAENPNQSSKAQPPAAGTH